MIKENIKKQKQKQSCQNQQQIKFTTILIKYLKAVLMIRQHFYPKTYFRHRSLTKGNSKFDSFVNENSEKIGFNQIQGNQIKMNRKGQILKQNNQQIHYAIHSTHTQEQEKYKNKGNSFILKSKNSLQSFKDGINLCNSILRQIDNRNNRNFQQKVKQNDLKNLYIKSDKKQILMGNGNSYRILKHSNIQIQNLSFQNSQKYAKKFAKTSRKFSSADGSNNTFRRSIQRKKKALIPPAQMIISSKLSTLQKKESLNAERKQLLFQKITDNLINLNLSKAIKYRSQTKQQKLRKQRKASIKINTQNIQNRKYELQQRVKGWEIQIQDDVDFAL